MITFERVTERVKAYMKKLRSKLLNLPITIFYKYLWEKNRILLAKTLVVSYVLPIILEILPWYVSRRKIGNYLRARRVKINHNMVTGKAFSRKLVLGYLGLTVLHAIIDTINRHMVNRLTLQNRLLIRRFVMERLLYSEIGGFNALKYKDNLGPTELEYKINTSIGLTLNFFNDTLPSIFASVYAFAREGTELLKDRSKIDLLLILHPVAMVLVHRIGTLIRTKLIDRKSGELLGYHNTLMTRMVCNALEGLGDIQVNNLQQAQMMLLDQMIADELSYSQGFSSFVSRTWSSISSRTVIDFIVEVWVAHSVMSRRAISNKEYRTMQLDIDRVIRLARRTYHSIRLAKHMWKDQSKVIKLLNIPNFIEEDKTLRRVSGSFQELRISHVAFAYKSQLGMLDTEMPPALDLQDEMVIEPGKRYALIGQNRAGKSTLNNLLCKLYAPDSGDITLDGIPYNEISRTSLRSFITYVSQRPFIFPGSIRDNILVGNPDASEEEVEAAAEAAGVFAFAEAAGFNWYRSPRSPYFDTNFDLYRNGSRDDLKALDEDEDEEDNDNNANDSAYESDDEFSLSNSPSKVKLSSSGAAKLEAIEKEIEKEAKIKLSIEKELKNEANMRNEAKELRELDKEERRATGDRHYGSSGSDDGDRAHNLSSAVKGVLVNKDFNMVFNTDKKSKKKGKKKHVLLPSIPLDLDHNNDNHNHHHHHHDGPNPNPNPIPVPISGLRRNSSAVSLHKSGSMVSLRRNFSGNLLHKSPSIGNNMYNRKMSLPHNNTTIHHNHHHHHHHVSNTLNPGEVVSTCNYNLNPSDCSPPKEKGWIGSFFAPTLPYAFPRAYPGDSDDDEEIPVRPPPVVPHKSGPHSSHPILDQEIEARGQNISGGFAQSIALARIFVRHETKILILDEAMSQMDAYKKREIIYPKLFEWSRQNNIALIIVTHDLQSIHDVDHVFVLDQGVLVHQGTHQELLEQQAEVYMRLLGLPVDDHQYTEFEN